MRLPNPVNGCCVECGSDDFLLAEDRVSTLYTDLKFIGEKWVRGKFHEEEETETTPEPVRLFCTTCSTYYRVPEGI